MFKIIQEFDEPFISKGVYYVNHVNRSLTSTGFMGSAIAVSLTSLGSIVHEAPGCIAAPLVNMIAKNSISLGMAGQGDQPVPVRLYAPMRLSITTKHLSIGDLMILVEPEYGFLTCKKLTLSKSTEEDPDYFEIVKSWAINDDMEVEVISTTPKSSKTEPKEDCKT